MHIFSILTLWIDTDNSGSVSVEELDALFTAIGHPIPEDVLKSLLSTVDTDNNGTLDFNEFATLLCLFMAAASEEGESA